MGLPALDSIRCAIPTEIGLSPETQAYSFGLCENTKLRVCLTSSQHSPTLAQRWIRSVKRAVQCCRVLTRLYHELSFPQLGDKYLNLPQTHKVGQDTKKGCGPRVQKMRTKRCIRMMGTHLIISSANNFTCVFCNKQLAYALH